MGYFGDLHRQRMGRRKVKAMGEIRIPQDVPEIGYLRRALEKMSAAGAINGTEVVVEIRGKIVHTAMCVADLNVVLRTLEALCKS